MARAELNWASFISGGGTTMAAMIDAVNAGEVDWVRPALVVSSTPDAGGIKKALDRGIPEDDIVVINPRKFRGADRKIDQLDFGRAINTEMKRRSVDFFTQNGWLHFTPEIVISEFEGFNQHPAPVPEFGGVGMHGQVPHAARLIFANMTGEINPVTEAVAQVVHPKSYDLGAVVGYRVVAIPPELLYMGYREAAQRLQELVLPHEHQVQIDLLNRFATGTIEETERPRYAAPNQEHILYEAKAQAVELYKSS